MTNFGFKEDSGQLNYMNELDKPKELKENKIKITKKHFQTPKRITPKHDINTINFNKEGESQNQDEQDISIQGESIHKDMQMFQQYVKN